MGYFIAGVFGALVGLGLSIFIFFAGIVVGTDYYDKKKKEYKYWPYSEEKSDV